MSKRRTVIAQLGKSLPIAVGLVLIWRGIWYMADWLDLTFFANNHLLTAVGGIVVGLLLLYLPDKNFNEIEKL